MVIPCMLLMMSTVIVVLLLPPMVMSYTVVLLIKLADDYQFLLLILFITSQRYRHGHYIDVQLIQTENESICIPTSEYLHA